jgi:serine/threonine-protein kinase RsbW
MAFEEFPDQHDNKFEGDTWTFESNPTEAAAAAHEVRVRLEALGWSDDEIGKFEEVMDEAIANAILHGNKKDSGKKVSVALRFDKDSDGTDMVEATITDEGGGFDPKEVADPTQGEGLTKESGRGIYLMKMYTDYLEFVPGEGKVIMRKRREAEKDEI